MTHSMPARGMIAVDKIGCQVLFLNPTTYETETVLDGFQRTVHELLVIPALDRAYVPIFGDGIHGRNPNPGHVLHVFDLMKRKLIHTIDLSPYVAPHTLRRGPADGLIYITCENSAKVVVIDPKTNTVVGAIDSGSTNGHRLCLPNDGRRLYTDNEEDATVSVIDVPARTLLGKIVTPQKLAGIAVAGDGRTVAAVSDEAPVVFLIDTASERITELPLKDVPKPAQIARYSADDRLLVVSSLNSNTLSIIDLPSGAQSAIPVGDQPMDFAFRGDEIVVGCQGDGSMHVIDVPSRRVTKSFQAGKGCESVGFF